jgi:hypothetical protein
MIDKRDVIRGTLFVLIALLYGLIFSDLLI